MVGFFPGTAHTILGKSAQQVPSANPAAITADLSAGANPINAPATSTPEAAAPTTSSNTPSTSASTASNYQLVDSPVADSILTGLTSGSGSPNVLNMYQNVAYHFRFFCVNDLDLYKASGSPSTAEAYYNAIIPDPNVQVGVASNNPSNIKTVVIAESGSTIYNITDVEFTSVIGPRQETRNVNIGTFQMTIVEPLGGSFLTALKTAADAVGNYNFKNCFYYLELSFKAYNSDGSVVTKIFPDVLNVAGSTLPLKLQQGDRWIWEVQITDIAISIESGGGSYVLSLVNSDGVGLEDEIHAIPDTISVSGATVGEYFSNLGVALSQSWFTRYGNYDVKYGDIANNIPAFKFFPIQLGPNSSAYPGITNGANPSDFAIVNKTVDPDTLPQQTRLTDIDNGIVQGIIQPGLTIEQLIESVIASTKQGQHLGFGGTNPYNYSSDNATTPKECFVFRVIPNITINGYNAWSGRYQITVTYVIFPFYTQYPILSPLQVSNDTSEAAIQNIVNRGLLQKRYDYIYTGLNTEVINLDISLNAKWNVQLPRFYAMMPDSLSVQLNKKIGSNPNVSNTNPTSVAQNSLNKKAILATQITAVQQLQNSLYSFQELLIQNSNSLTPDVLSAAANINQQAVYVNSVTAGTATKLVLPISTQSSSAAINSTKNARTAASTTSEILQNQFNSGQKPPEFTTSSTSNYLFAENLVTNSSGAPGTFSFPITFGQNFKNSYDQSGINIGNDNSTDKTILGSVLNQLYDYSANPLMQIDLTIRGDPYWLGETNLSKCVYFRGTGSPPPASSYQPPQMFGEMCMILYFKIPYQESSTTFQPVLTNDMAYTGVYIVTQVTNSFTNGQFTQVLSGKRLPLISLLNKQGITTSQTSDGSNDVSASSSPSSSSPATSNNISASTLISRQGGTTSSS